ncbi:MAG: DUF4350 domain-containing protein [Actinomycetia bacterium]|nr:DUF4350 domain-containing protein [Actinomycetes bacterium]
MSARQAKQSSGSGARVGLSALLVVAIAVIMLLLVRARPEAEPFDPRSSDSLGTRGLVLLLEQQGASVDIARSAPGAGADARVLVLQDRLNDSQRQELLQFVEAGGLLVMADPDSEILEGLVVSRTIEGEVPAFAGNDPLEQTNVPLDECDVPALAQLRGLFVIRGSRFRVPEGARSCFVDNGSAFAIVGEYGAGLIVQLGDNELFTNHLLRYADNGPLAAALLAPNADAQVSILLGEEAAKSTADIGTGEKTLSDLLRPSVWMALAQLALAFIIFATARAVRPGRPVREPEQVPVAGSELVVATGTLMRRARHAERAGWMLRGNLYRALCQRFHLPTTASIAALDEVVAANTSLPVGHVAAVLQREVHDDKGLLELSNSLQAIRAATLETLEGANS